MTKRRAIRAWLGLLAAAAFQDSAATTPGCTSEAWSSHTSVYAPTTLAMDGDTLWMGSLFGGVLQWDIGSADGRIHTRSAHCLPDNEVRDLAVTSSGDLAGEVWIAGPFGAGRRLSNSTFESQWHLFNADNSGIFDPLADSVGITDAGAVWVGTFNSGAFRFDGDYWDEFSPLNSGLGNTTVTSVQPAGARIWFGTWGGMFLLEDGAFSRLTPGNTGTPPDFCQAISPRPPEQLGLTSSVVDVLDAEEATGVVWVASLDDGDCLNTTTSRFDGEQWLTFSPFNSDIAADAMMGATTAPGGREALASLSGSQFFDPQDRSFTAITFPDGSPLSATDVERRGDELWFASPVHGLVRWANGQLTAFPAPGLRDNLVQDLLLIEPAEPAGEPVAWVAHRRGAQRRVGEDWEIYDPENSPIAGYDINAVVRGGDGAIWFGTAVSGVTRFDGGNWTTFNAANSGLASNNIAALAVDPVSGELWAAYEHDIGVARFDGQAWIHHTVGPRFGSRAMLVDRSGRIWLAGTTQVVRFDGTHSEVVNSGLPSTNTAAFALGANNEVYVGTDMGAAVWDEEGDSWQPLPQIGSPVSNVRALGVDADGHLWAGAWDVGLAEYDGESWTVYATADGLTNNRVHVIRFAPDDSVWAGTEEGISVFNQHLIEPGERQNINYGHSGGWFEPATSGQGFMIDINPEAQYMFNAWFTFDTSSPQQGGDIPGAEQRWLTAEGHYAGHRAELVIYQTRDGVFNDPAPVRQIPVGSMVVEFTSCTSGTASYHLPGVGLAGEIPITRLLEDEVCTSNATGSAELTEKAPRAGAIPTGTGQDINYGLIGGWFEPATGGQGFMLDFITERDFVFLAWFTFDTGTPLADGEIPGAEQRWLTAEGTFEGNRAELLVFQTRNGVFDTPPPVDSVPVGNIVLEFESCTSGTLDYDLPEFGLSGQIPITKLLEDEICTSMNSGVLP